MTTTDATLPFKELALEGAEFVNPRQKVDAKAIGELADSILAQGLLHPLLVWATKDGEGNAVNVIIDGGRRYRAIAKLIKSKKPRGLNKAVPVRLIEAKTLAEARRKALTTSVQREELSSYEVAAAIAQMVDEGDKQKDIAKALGKSQTWVSRQLSAFRNSEEIVKEAWRDGKLPDDDVQHLAKLDEAEQLKRFDKIMALRNAAEADVKNSREAKAKARQVAKGNDKPKEPAAERKLRPSAETLEGFIKIAAKAKKSDEYVRGLHDAMLFALGELGAGEFDKKWRDFAAKHIQTDAQTDKASANGAAP